MLMGEPLKFKPYGDQKMSLKASFLGLGSMGFPMAFNLLKQGVDLAVYNRSKEKAEPLIKAGAKLLNHPSQAFKHAPIAFSMVANDQALEAITEGLLESAYPGCIHISSSTVAPATTQKLFLKFQEKGSHLIAAPVFGRPDAAAKQALWICIAGNKAAKKQAEPFLNRIGKKIYDFGDNPEAVSAVKLAGNFMILSAIEMMGEAFAFVEQKGVDPEELHNFLTETLFPSPIFVNYGKQIIKKKFRPAGFTMTLGSKDLNLFLNTAKSLNVATPLAQVLQSQLHTSLDKGREDMDWSAISLLPLEGNSETI
jgi:3-hydroxyisobutyrate dehydrogenase-like beta-hydroxyacid dehydrogenase